MPPDNGRTQPAVNGMGSESDQQGSLITAECSHHDQLRAEVAAGVEAAVIGGLLRCSAADAAPILDVIDPEMFASPTLRFAVHAITAAVEAGTDPSPLVAADAAVRAGIDHPPAWHRAVITELTALSCTAPPLPTLRWYADRLIDYTAWRAAEATLRSALDQLGRADGLTELAAVMRSSADRLQTLAGAGR